MKYFVFSIKTIYIFFILYTIYQILNTPVFALNMNSNSFQIESANINDAAGNKTSTSYKLSDTVGQLAAAEFNSSGYTIKAGFQYLRKLTPFKFQLSTIKIDFGEMIPNVPKTATIGATVSFNGAGQYQVTAAEIGPLKNFTGSYSVPDTTCDSGSSCSINIANVWNLTSTYGFGYNMSGTDIPIDFTGSTFFRPFADINIPAIPAVVMSSTQVGLNKQSVMTLKLNVSPIQAAGSYQTILSFIATPSY